MPYWEYCFYAYTKTHLTAQTELTTTEECDWESSFPVQMSPMKSTCHFPPPWDKIPEDGPPQWKNLIHAPSKKWNLRTKRLISVNAWFTDDQDLPPNQRISAKNLSPTSLLLRLQLNILFCWRSLPINIVPTPQRTGL